MKDWIKSKTVWLALLQAASGAVLVFQSAYPEIGGLIIAKSVIDIILRFITTEPIK